MIDFAFDNLMLSIKSGDNGINPVWSSETFVFNISYPELALIRFLVCHHDTFDDSSFVGQATYPVMCLRQGLYLYILKMIYSNTK